MGSQRKTIEIIGIPMDLGQALRGVDMGPSAIRYAGLKAKLQALGFEVRDAGNIMVPIRDNIDDDKQAFFESIVGTLEEVYKWAQGAKDRKTLPIFIGGDHSIAIGTIGGITDPNNNPKNITTGVIWIDAHGDFNTLESSPSGNVHGMPLSSVVGIGKGRLIDLGRPGPKISPENVVLMGIRDLDGEERELIKKSGISVFTMRDIDELGIATVMYQALKKLSNVDRIHVSFDLDAVDPSEAPGVGTPVPGGFSYRETHLIMEILADSHRVSSVDIVELNPILDVENRTGKLAVDMLTSLLGKSIM